MPNNLHTWETVFDNSDQQQVPTVKTQRMRVPGGWIYRTVRVGAAAVTESSVFVPDPKAVNPGGVFETLTEDGAHSLENRGYARQKQ
jgi:hypothetical protein